MSESNDYDPGPWTGYDFKSARADYDAYVGRSYDDAVEAGKTTKDLIPESITSNSSAPVIIVIDETGSMGDWPATIKSKLPYLDNEMREYLGEDAEICFMAIGDAHNNEKYALQVRPFAKGTEMASRLEELIFEGQGGSQTYETYELAALYALYKVNIPNAVKPIIIFLGDEQFYDVVDREHARNLVGVNLEKVLTAEALFKALKDKYAVYHIRKPYGCYYDSDAGSNNRTNEIDARVTAAWTRVLGEDHIAPLPKADRVVDVIFGIFAKESGRIAYFENEIEDRQVDKEKTLKAKAEGRKKVDIVYKSLRSIHKIPEHVRTGSKHTGKSVMRKSVAVAPARSVKPLI